ncbi:uncharacterized protein [Argopecten irradians]|uniref:uncharacterized protein n=1 Tax=Argopecten irradians TaxID=31199 RepID=UPI0037224435
MEIFVIVVFLVLLKTKETDGECEGCTYGCCTTARGDGECCTAIVPVFGVIAAVTSCGVVIAIVVIICCCRRQRSDESKKGRSGELASDTAPSIGTAANQRYPLMPLRCRDCEERNNRFWTDTEGQSWPLGTIPGNTFIPTPTGSMYSIRTSTVVDLPSYQQNLSVY